ncbi:MAG: prenyltransferase [candidate division Zixibacteria bacterium]|nr:prenyltransferase [candidate division Zixibacteria bacterium]
MSVKVYLLETRPQFLLLSPILVMLGMGMALYNGNFNTLNFALSMIGLLLLHISVNTLNDYSDFKTGIDLNVKRTPFSGGSGLLPSGALSASSVLKLGLASFFLAVPIGIYFLVTRGFYLLPIFIIGAIFVLWYTSHITHIVGMPELAAGLGLGTLPVFGTFMILNGSFAWEALFASVPSGLLVCNLLLLNEFPDIEADKTGRRKTLPIILGAKKAAVIYSMLIILVYLWVIGGVLLKLMPIWSLLALLTLPLGIKAIKGAMTFKKIEELIPAQGANVMTVLLTQLLLAVGYVLARVIS